MPSEHLGAVPPKIELILIGNELLNGDLVDTNTQRLAGRLRQLGLRVSGAQTVPDEDEAIGAAFALAAGRAQLVLVSGGLGPTSLAGTLGGAAAFAGARLVQHAATLTRLRGLYAARGLPFTEGHARQALVPEGAEVLDNPEGTAPHVQLVAGGARFFFFPGVPRELEAIVEAHLVPRLAASGLAAAYDSLYFKTFGRTESQIAAALSGVLPEDDPSLHVAYRAHFPEIHVSLHAYHPGAAAREAALHAAGAAVTEALGDLVFARDPRASLAAVVGGLLASRGQTVSTAESCTGGLLGGAITSVPGSSAWFREGFVTYANEAKTRALGVPKALLDDHGAVSEAVARAMAEGARAVSGADWAIAVTGIAGPGGGSPDKPVGTVHLALAGPEGTRHVLRRLPFGRDRNRTLTVHMALDILRKALIDC